MTILSISIAITCVSYHLFIVSSCRYILGPSLQFHCNNLNFLPSSPHHRIRTIQDLIYISSAITYISYHYLFRSRSSLLSYTKQKKTHRSQLRCRPPSFHQHRNMLGCHQDNIASTTISKPSRITSQYITSLHSQPTFD